ncbi:winged helix-turn-helix domain-containing protein [Roseovarius sp. MMSF_3305]|uniref:winged helix-turn-helix domain-containing protein n=1 Tax=Roseovarius sp. MMSF_3305 TaxID=3046697 RepID=UPI00273EDB71|nr:winged helix-turn-helix domain-containing protein [Roseovarius sp. MMSF_3305]
MALFLLICLVLTARLWSQDDPWDVASLRAIEDSATYAQQVGRADQIGFSLGQQPFIANVLIWDQEGTLLYPTSDGFTPIRYELTALRIKEIETSRASAERPFWAPFDHRATKLLTCLHEANICLIYRRAELEQELGLESDALAKVTEPDRTALLAVMSLAVVITGAALLWGLRPARPAPAAFELIADQFIARRGDLTVELTARDVAILDVLMKRDGAVVTKDDLYNVGWGRDFMPNSRALDQHMINLRQKLDPDKSRPHLIHTVRGIGYRLEV